MKKYFVIFIGFSLLLGAGRLAFADSVGGEAEADASASRVPAHVSVFARLTANFESRMEKLRERLLKERRQLEERMEKKHEQIENKFERKIDKLEVEVERKVGKIEHRPRPPHATSTPATPFILEIGARGHVFMRGFVTTSASSTIGMQSWGGVWNVRIASTTRLLAHATTTPDFLIGDYIGIEGAMSTGTPFTIDATLLRDRTP